MENHYETLGVNENDTQETIKKKYRKLSLKYHPDKPTGDVEMFKKITGAYEVIGDEEKRKEYDMQRKNPFANMGMDDNFDTKTYKAALEYTKGDINGAMDALLSSN